jgi:hypothetical protein
MLTRAQLLAGDSGQGVVLPGQVQAVKAGTGILIGADGTISVDGTTVTGVVRLNNITAYNNYIWPNSTGAAGQYLQLTASNILAWTNPSVYVNSTQPASPFVGGLWYDTSTSTLNIYQTSVAPLGWTATAQPPGLGLVVSGSAVKVSIPIQFGPPVAGTLPTQAVDGSVYWDNNLGEMFIRYNDGTSTQWVQITPSGGGGGGGTGTVTSVGITGSGGITSVGGPITSSGTITVGFSIPALPVLP